MASCMKEIRLEYEIGEVDTFRIVEEINGFWICYHSVEYTSQKPDTSDLHSLIKRVKYVMDDLDIQISHFALEIISNGGRGACCAVTKDREACYVLLPVHIRGNHIALPDRGVHEDYVLYHELMHVKNCIEHRFPSAGRQNYDEDPLGYLTCLVEDLSIEGILEERKKPHHSKEEYTSLAHQCFEDYCNFVPRGEDLKELITKTFFEKLCESAWGKEIDYRRAKTILKEQFEKFDICL